jgi:hypothetical protein
MAVLGADNHFRTATPNVHQERLFLAEMHTANDAKVDQTRLFKP